MLSSPRRKLNDPRKPGHSMSPPAGAAPLRWMYRIVPPSPQRSTATCVMSASLWSAAAAAVFVFAKEKTDAYALRDEVRRSSRQPSDGTAVSRCARYMSSTGELCNKHRFASPAAFYAASTQKPRALSELQARGYGMQHLHVVQFREEVATPIEPRSASGLDGSWTPQRASHTAVARPRRVEVHEASRGDVVSRRA